MRKQISALFLALILVSGLAGVAEAHKGHWTYMPGFYGSGAVIFDSSTGGRLYADYDSGQYCVYVQYRGAHKWAVDNSTWHRGTNNSCGAGVTNSFSFSNYYDGVRVRLCQDVPYQSDPCGSSITHYTW